MVHFWRRPTSKPMSGRGVCTESNGALGGTAADLADGEPFCVLHAHRKLPDLERIKGTETIRRAVAHVQGTELVEVVGRSQGEALGLSITCRLPWASPASRVRDVCPEVHVHAYTHPGVRGGPYGSGNPAYPVDDSN